MAHVQDGDPHEDDEDDEDGDRGGHYDEEGEDEDEDEVRAAFLRIYMFSPCCAGGFKP